MTDSNRSPRALAWSLLGLMVLATAWSVMAPTHPLDHYLSNLPTLAFLISLPFLFRDQGLGNGSLVALTVFVLLHVVGVRWLYSNVPYEDWTRELFGTGLNEAMGWRRNHYDRLVHFSYGLLTTLPLAQYLERRRGCPRKAALAIAVTAVFAASAFYEIVEWAVAVIAAPEAAERYNGQQGDPFDAQKDMALAALGSFVSLLLPLVRGLRSPS